MEKDDSMETSKPKSPDAEMKGLTLDVKEEVHTKGDSAEENSSLVSVENDGNEKADIIVAEKMINDLPDNFTNEQENDDLIQKNMLVPSTPEGNASHVLIEDDNNKKMEIIAIGKENGDPPRYSTDGEDKYDHDQKDMLNSASVESSDQDSIDDAKEDLVDASMHIETPTVSSKEELKMVNDAKIDEVNHQMNDSKKLGSENEEKGHGNPDEVKGGENGELKMVNNEKIGEVNHETNDSKKFGSEDEEKGNENPYEAQGEENSEPVFDGTEVPGMEANRSTSSLDLEADSQGSLADKAAAIKNFVREKSVVAVSSVIRRLSGKSDDAVEDNPDDVNKDDNGDDINKDLVDTPNESETKEALQKTGEKAGWNPLSLIGISRDSDVENKTEQQVDVNEESILLPIPMKGRILLYTRLGCKECREARMFLHRKKLRYVEINIDVYPSRKLELEKIVGSSSVPKVFFNEILVGGMSEIKALDESGKLNEKIEYVVGEVPPFEAPLPPLSGEDDMSTFGQMDELALIVRKMKETILVKDRFYKMRRFTNCFLGSDAVNFLSEDQYLEREDAVEFGRKLARGLFFQHVLEENIFEDGNHLYRFLDHDPIVMSQCYNIPRGIIEVKPKPITEISARLRFLSYAMFEAYTTEDGRHVDYRSIHGSEEFARYLRIVEELQRVDMQNMMREEKLAFFINLFNMMVIHAILILGHPNGALERRKMLGDFTYIIGGCTYSLSAIQNGILRGNQRPPYNLTKPFGLKDKRSKVALPYSEPLTHFALVFGNRSGPPLRCYSPGEIDKELMDAARNFLRIGGLNLDLYNKVASASKIFKWYSTDFGKNEVEVLKHAANYLEPVQSEAMLELLATTQFKVLYQPYDWGLNN